MAKTHNRDYGYDSISASKSGKSALKIGYRARVQYHFDNAISKPANFILFLIGISVILGAVMTLIGYLMLPDPQGSFLDDWWNSFTNILGVGKGASWPERLINFLYWAFGLIISGTVIGFLASRITSFVRLLKRGRSRIILQDHILILGWSNNIQAVISELSKANENVKNANIVIFSSHDNQFMQDQIELYYSGSLSIPLVTRSGDITSIKDLALVNPGSAKNIIILGEDKGDDVSAVIALLAVYTYVKGKSSSIIVQVNKKESLRLFEDIKDVNIIPVLNKDVMANVCSQAIRQKGIGNVILDFLDFEGSEIYYYPAGILEGKKYGEAVMSFNTSSVIGIYSSANKAMLNPSEDTVIQKDDSLIVIAEDDDSISICNQIYSEVEVSNEQISTSSKPGNLMLIGWSSFGKSVLDNYTPFRSDNTKVYVIYENDLVTDLYYSDEDAMRNAVEFIDSTKSNLKLSSFIIENEIRECLILSYLDALSIQQADAFTLIKMLELNNFNCNNQTRNVRVVAQLLDSTKSELARFTETEELIVSDNLSALLIAQYAENPLLKPVLDDLFDAEGASINLYPLSGFIKHSHQVRFSDLVAAGIKKGYSVIGVSRSKTNDYNSGVILNPAKDSILELQNEDQVIVIS